MTLITADELARAGILVVFGGGAGMGALLAPGSLVWAAPALLGAIAMSFTVPEVRTEVRTSLPALREAVRALPRPAALLPQRGSGHAVAAAASVPSAPPPAPAGGSAPVPAGALRPRQWLQMVNDEPDRAPHAMVIGPSGAGKTTFTAAMLGRRTGDTLVLSPKVNAGNWRGAEVVTLDDDGQYTPIAAALDALEEEKRGRIRALRLGRTEPLRPLTVVLDETPELLHFVPDTGPFMVSMSSIGRELGIRLVVISTRSNALNVKGWKASESNFVRINLDRDRNATLDDGMGVQPLDLGHVQQGAERAQLRPWRGAMGASIPASIPASTASYDLLAALLDAPASAASSASGRQDAPVTAPTSAPNALDADVGAAGLRLDMDAGPQHLTFNLSATASGAPGRARYSRRGKGLDMRHRHQMHLAAQQEAKKDELRRAYAAKKAEGWSHRKAFAELGGNSDESRAWWKAAPAPTKELPQ